MDSRAFEPRPFDAAQSRKTLPQALLDARDRFGGSKEILEDPERTPLTYDRLILGALVLGRKLKQLQDARHQVVDSKGAPDSSSGIVDMILWFVSVVFGAIGWFLTSEQERRRVGVLLPNVNGVAVTVFGLQFHGLTPVLLNFTAGLKNLKSACETAEITTIVTSRRFVDTAKLDETVAGLSEGRQIIYLEDVRKTIGLVDKIRGVVRSKFARGIARRAGTNPDEAAVILFTSGSEGVPKGVVLSHANIVGNAAQIWDHAEGMLNADDVAFNPLPVFHSFGLTAGTMLGLFNGMKIVFYPSPLHYKQVPKLIAETKATLLFSTDTFLVGYARAADEGDLDSLRLVVTGAEKVKDSTRLLWEGRGATILEGYGCTECSPVLACNIPTDNRFGTVGRLLPGVEARLDPVEGISDGGKLVVRGCNVMAGYLMADQPGVLRPPADGWHDTGDIVDLDEAGFVTIKGRAKRFAKIGGEMVSLAAVETLASNLWPGTTHVGVSLPDPKKGEQIVLVSDDPNADRAALQAYAREQGIPELYVPRAILVVNAIPVLGSGKVDYGGTTELVKTMRTLI